MKRAVPVFAGLLVACLSIGAPPAFAGQLPQGSYLQSCRDARLVGGTLLAMCRQPDGEYWGTSGLAEIRNCVGDIVNRSGALDCERGPLFGSSAKKSAIPKRRDAGPASEIRPAVGLP